MYPRQRQRRHFVEAVKRQATKVLEIFIREFIMSTEISDTELPFNSFRGYEFGLNLLKIKTEK